MQNKKVLVTGGAGFIGSWLCEELLKQNYQVICIDNFYTGTKENIAHLKKDKNFEFLLHDVVEPIKKDFGKIDYVFHLASPASIPDEQKDPIKTLLVNSVGTLNLLELAREGNARFLFASTSEVYGSPVISPQPETYWGNVNPIGIRSCYDEGKRFGEALCIASLRMYSMDIRIARIFNTYGERNKRDDGRVIPNFINQALENKPLTVYGDGNQTRSLCYVSDLVEGLLKFMFLDGLAGEIINLGNPNEKTVLELAQVIKRLANSSSTLIFKPLPKDDPERRCPDISKSKKLLNWQPQVSLEEGLQKTIEWYKKS